jgi:hypothetical protein
MSRVALVLIALPALLVPAQARAEASIARRVATSDLVVIVKVTDFADKFVEAKPFPGTKSKANYQIAKCKVENALFGKAGKEIKVGFILPTAGPDPDLIDRPHRSFKLDRGQEACVFLVKHPTADFYIGLASSDVITKAGNANFDKDMTEVKRCIKLLADPDASLKSREAEDRFLTAAMLVVRYRTLPLGDKVKTELVSADQSKRILKALAEAKWDGKFSLPEVGPQALFLRLGLTEKDGWTQPKDFKEIPAAAKKWLKDNTDKYRIKRLVPETKKDKK